MEGGQPFAERAGRKASASSERGSRRRSGEGVAATVLTVAQTHRRTLTTPNPTYWALYWAREHDKFGTTDAHAVRGLGWTS